MECLYKKFLISALFLVTPLTHVHALESGRSSYSLGGDSFSTGALPPPGLYFLGYYQRYDADRFNNQNGDSMIPNFDLSVDAYVPRFVWMTNEKILGGQLGFHIINPLVKVQNTVGNTKDSTFGFGDLLLASVLAWHDGSHHYATGLEVAFPTGTYSENALANLGYNHYTIRPMVAYTFMNEDWDASLKLTYNFNSENKATNYRSGEYFAGDYNLGYHLTPKLSVGAQGYFLKQITDDEITDKKIDFKSQVLGYGLGISYKLDKGYSFEAKYITETAVKNRTEGNTAWLRFVMPVR